MVWDKEMLALDLPMWFWIRRVQLASADVGIYLAYKAVQLCYVFSNLTLKCNADMWKELFKDVQGNILAFFVCTVLINFCRIGQVSQHSAPLDTLKAMKLVKGTAATVHWLAFPVGVRCHHPFGVSRCSQRWTYQAGCSHRSCLEGNESLRHLTHALC